MDLDLAASGNSKAKPAHPAIFMVLLLPYGIMQGYLTVTLAYLYHKAGMPVEDVAALVGLSLLPNIFKFVWGPLIDLTLSVKKWYLIANVTTAAGMFLMGVLTPIAHNFWLLGAVVFVAFFASTFVCLAASSFMAYDTTEETKGRAGGWYNIGGLGGIGLGGAAGLWLAQYVSAAWMVGAGLGIACLFCFFAIPFVKEPESAIRANKVGQNLANLFKDIWLTIKEKAAVLALFLAFLPLGTGAAGSLFAAMATDWHAGVNIVALVTGLLGAGATSIGCLVGGYLCDIMNRQRAYVLFGLAQALCAVGMAFCPHTEIFFVCWTLAYAFANGLAFSGFTAFVLEVIGKGAAATKYNLYAGLANIPIYLVTIADGWGDTKWGPNGTLLIEAACAGAGILLFYLFKALMGKKRVSPAPG